MESLKNNKNTKSQTVFFKNKPNIIGFYSAVGPKESKGNLGKYFHEVEKNDFFGEKTYEKAERSMMERVFKGAIRAAKLESSDIKLYLAGDLLNQIISSSYTARAFDIPFVGVFGACSTMAESLALGACLVSGNTMDTVACCTSSHFSTAERQFRYPLELGTQRPPTAQWTVTGSGCTILSAKKRENCPYISSATFGKVTDFGICDVNNMGAAMAPAAMSTLIAHFKDTKSKPEDYDLILTGDLGKLGSEILIDLMEDHGYKLSLNYKDCGQMIFKNTQKVLMGGSGCGCSASVLNSVILKKMIAGEYKKVLFVATGALLSTISSQQGDSIPGIAHAVVIEMPQQKDLSIEKSTRQYVKNTKVKKQLKQN